MNVELVWELFKVSPDFKKGHTLEDLKEWTIEHTSTKLNETLFEFELAQLGALKDLQDPYECPSCESTGIKMEDSLFEFCDVVEIYNHSSDWRCDLCKGSGEISTRKHNSLLF